MGRRTRVTVLCEDLQQAVFARRFLGQYGIDSRDVRARFVPGCGAGEQNVRTEYSKEVREHRRRNYQKNIALVVFIDADTRSVNDRLGQLDDELVRNSLPRREPDEKIGVFVPKRNIETWIHYLMGETVNEDKAYPKLERKGDCKPYVAAFARDCREHRSMPEDAPASLKAACGELVRIL